MIINPRSECHCGLSINSSFEPSVTVVYESLLSCAVKLLCSRQKSSRSIKSSVHNYHERLQPVIFMILFFLKMISILQILYACVNSWAHLYCSSSAHFKRKTSMPFTKALRHTFHVWCRETCEIWDMLDKIIFHINTFDICIFAWLAKLFWYLVTHFVTELQLQSNIYIYDVNWSTSFS